VMLADYVTRCLLTEVMRWQMPTDNNNNVDRLPLTTGLVTLILSYVVSVLYQEQESTNRNKGKV
jgi:hypothetical protein